MENNNLKFITGLRGLAALFVMLSHIWYQIWPAVQQPYGYGIHPIGLINTLTGWLYYGHFGVVVFIVISGFCLTRSVVSNEYKLEQGLSDFFIKRAYRILPPYYCAIIFSLVLIHFLIGEKTGSQWDISIPVTEQGIVTHFFLLQDILEPTQINYVFWSIALEVHLYIIFPILLYAWRKFSITLTNFIICGIVYTIIAYLEVNNYKEIPPQFIGLFIYFILGMTCAVVSVSQEIKLKLIRESFRWDIAAFLFIALLFLMCMYWGTMQAEEKFIFLDPICALATFFVIQSAYFSQKENKIKMLLENKKLLAIGAISYSLYLIHAPILQLILQYIVMPFQASKDIQFFVLLLLSVPICLLIAYIFFLLFEKPFLSTNIRINQEQHQIQNIS